MTGPPAATAACRLAVRRVLADHDGPVLAAVSGGADSLALAAALAFVRPGSGALVVDHALQAGSAEVAARAAEQCTALGLAAQVLTPADHGEAVRSPRVAGGPQLHDRREGGGPEAAARELRYALLEAAAGDAVVLLGHTRDDQAESVLLGLVRGSGARALSGMAPVRGRYRRPFLDLPRALVRKACAEAGLVPHEDPHNEDPSYTRVRARRVLAELDVTDGLARSAALLREDADALDALVEPTDDVAALAAMLPALRARALKRWAEERCGRSVTGAHVQALRALVEDWHGQGPVALPGGGRVSRAAGRLAFTP
ncbi:MAG TPA: tRNA lysidine(34) synthetase TilS [Mycobacteriales bacterium]|nr:tRNA lysidine(34) synthetase TilS [Mycobacteriales bacterium]